MRKIMYTRQKKDLLWGGKTLVSGIGFITIFLFVGCASVETQSHPKSLSGEALAKPDKVLIYNFAVSPDEIELERGIGGDVAELVKGTEGTPRSLKAMELGGKVANSLSENLVKELRSYGILAERASEYPKSTDNVIFVTGRFLSIDEGNSTQRMIIGFGLGRSVVRAQGQVYSMRPEGPKLLNEFESEVKSGRKPGVGPIVGVGAAAGGGLGALGNRRNRRESDERRHQADIQQQQSRQSFNRAYGTCLEGRGYKVG